MRSNSKGEQGIAKGVGRLSAQEVSRNGDETKRWFQSLEFVLEYILKHQSSEKASLFLNSLMTRLTAAAPAIEKNNVFLPSFTPEND